MLLAIFSKIFVTYRATFRDSFLLHGHVNYTKHKSNIYKAMLMHILIMTFKSCSYFNVCVSLNTISKFNSLFKGCDRFFFSAVFQIITHMKM